MPRLTRKNLMALDPETRAKIIAAEKGGEHEPHAGKPRRQRKRAFAPGEGPKRPTRKEAAEKRERKAATRAMQWAHLPEPWHWRDMILPFPPTVNTYWRHVGRNVVISREGRAYRAAVVKQEATRKPMEGRLTVRVSVYPPDARARDLDNLGKAVLDALTAAHVYFDDSQIDRLEFVRGDVEKGGKVIVSIEAFKAKDGAA